MQGGCASGHFVLWFFWGLEIVALQNWVAKSRSQNFIEKITAVVQVYLQEETILLLGKIAPVSSAHQFL